MIKLRQKINQKGAVSLFVVIFATLLISIVTVSFTRIMVQHQQQANAADLSQSAYDSAKAGVEDGKRLLAYLQNACNTGSADCAAIKDLLDPTKITCNAGLSKIGITADSTSKEIKIQSSTSTTDNKLDQAYTCLKIALSTDSYLGELLTNESKIIPLKGVKDFDKVQIEWFTKKNMTSGGTVTLSPPQSPSPLLSQSSWGANRPSLMRTQFIQYNTTSGFDLSQLDAASNSRTAFLYPTSIVASNTNLESTRRDGTIIPNNIRCVDLSSGSAIYSCSATVSLGTVRQADGVAYLRLSALYNNSQFKITLLDGTGKVVNFDGVQPEIDSTGRANTLFRRVKSRVELSDTSFPYPEAAVDITGNFCKDFIVTDMESDYSNICTP